VAFGNDGALYFRRLGSAKLDRGSITVRLDWSAAASMFLLGAESQLQALDDPALLVSPGLGQAAGLRPASVADAASAPAWELMLWRGSRSPVSKLLTSLPVASDSLPDDGASLAWLDDRQLAVCAPSYAGLDSLNWRLIVVETARGRQTLVADHLPPRSPVVAMDGCLFYCRQEASTGAWQLWACGTDGLDKRLLYRAEETHNLTLADAYSGKLLLNRQYFGEDGASLINDLLELALVPLAAWRISESNLRSPLAENYIDLDSPEGPRPDNAPAQENGFIPDKPGGASKDPADRYRKRGGGGNDGGGGDKEPPDLSLPGL